MDKSLLDFAGAIQEGAKENSILVLEMFFTPDNGNTHYFCSRYPIRGMNTAGFLFRLYHLIEDVKKHPEYKYQKIGLVFYTYPDLGINYDN